MPKVRLNLTGFPDAEEIGLFGSWDRYSVRFALTKDGPSNWRGDWKVDLKYNSVYGYHYLIDGLYWYDVTQSVTTVDGQTFNIVRTPPESMKIEPPKSMRKLDSAIFPRIARKLKFWSKGRIRC